MRTPPPSRRQILGGALASSSLLSVVDRRLAFWEGAYSRHSSARCFSELPIYRAFPGDRTRSFHRAQARKSLWKRHC